MTEQAVEQAATEISEQQGLAEAPTLIRIEYYTDDDPENPTAWNRFRTRQVDMAASGENLQWASIVCDSVTSASIAARKHSQYVLSPNAKESRLWFASATDALEEAIYIRLGAWRTNVIVVAHQSDDKDEFSGGYLRSVSAPGRLSKSLTANYSEFYHSYIKPSDQGGEFWLQTRNDGRFYANSAINAPNPCAPRWKELWNGFAKEKVPLHVVAFGDPGVGKSTFAATGPKPMLVFMFDGWNKDMPYLNRGMIAREFEEVVQVKLPDGRISESKTFVREIVARPRAVAKPAA